MPFFPPLFLSADSNGDVMTIVSIIYKKVPWKKTPYTTEDKMERFLVLASVDKR